MVAYVSENILPEWAQKTAIASAFRTVGSNAFNYCVMGFTGGVVWPTLLKLVAGPAISAVVAYDKKTGGRLEEQTQCFLKEGGKVVVSMELVATKAPENALKVMKLATNAFRELFWPAEEASDREVLAAATTVSVVSSETEETNSGSTSYFGRASQLFSNLADKISSGFLTQLRWSQLR